jgi:hypothetical protein
MLISAPRAQCLVIHLTRSCLYSTWKNSSTQRHDCHWTSCIAEGNPSTYNPYSWIQPSTTCTSSHLPLFSLCSISLDTRQSRRPSTRKQLHRLHSTLSNIFEASLEVGLSQLLYERSRSSSSGHTAGNLFSAMGAGRFRSAICVMVGGRERTIESVMGVEIRMKVLSDGGIGFSESHSNKSCEVLLCELLSRTKKSSRRVACGPTTSNSPSA